MSQSSAAFEPSRRRFLRSGMSLVGFGLALIAPSLLGGCGDDKGGVTQIEAPVDVTKTPGGMDSMKAYQSEKKEHKGGTPKK